MSARLAARAGVGGTTLTELADTLVRDEGLPFKTAHSIAALLLKARNEDPDASLSDALAKASAALLGRRLEYAEEQLQKIMSPRYFVEVRRTLGGPAPRRPSRALGESRPAARRAMRAEWQARRDHLTRAPSRQLERASPAAMSERRTRRSPITTSCVLVVEVLMILALAWLAAHFR